MKGWTLHTYDEGVCPLRWHVSTLFGTGDLSGLHELATADWPREPRVGMDSATEFHRRFYDCLRTGWGSFTSDYRRLVEQYAAPVVGEAFYPQARPTFRVHLPNSLAVGEMHRDTQFGHPDGEVNFIVPLTEMWESNSTWIECEDGMLRPVMAGPGNLVVFSGGEALHGNYPNLTGRTRVSLDFRCLPERLLPGGPEHSSLTTGTKFVPGAYYVSDPVFP